MLALRTSLLLVYGFFIVHYVACLWWAVGGSVHYKNWRAASGAAERDVGAQYLFSLSWVVTTMTTVGGWVWVCVCGGGGGGGSLEATSSTT